MKRLACALLSCLIVQAATATPANANIWRWIEELSGPGSFWGGTFEFRVKCWGEAPILDPGSKIPITGGIGMKFPCPKDAEPGKYYRFTFNVEGGLLHAFRNPIKYRRDGALVDGEGMWLFPAQAMLYWEPIFGVELGTGGGVFVFNNSQFSAFGIPVIEPIRVDIRPFDMVLDPANLSNWANFRRTLTLRVGCVILPKRITAVRFGGTAADNTLDQRHERLLSLGLVLDYGAWRKKK